MHSSLAPGQATLGGYCRDFRGRDPRDGREPPPPRDNVGRDMGRERYMPPPPPPCVLWNTFENF